MARVGAGNRERDSLSNTRGAEGERLVRRVKLLSRDITPGVDTDDVRDYNRLVVVAVARARQGSLFDYTRCSSLL